MKNTPAANTGSAARHNGFDFTLEPGQAKVLPVVPMTALGGGVKLVVWVPKR